MRGLNLSRLAARGRAAEGLYSAKEQAGQATALRAKLSAGEVSALRADGGGAAPTVDVLGSISGQGALARLALARARADAAAPAGVVRGGALPEVLLRSSGGAGAAVALSPPPLRALGANKIGLYQRIAAREPPARALPGADKYADGAAVGAASLSVATAIVGSVGAAGIGVLYFHPTLVDDIRFATRRFARRVDDGLGKRLRAFAARMRENGVLSEATQERARSLARKAVHASAAVGLGTEDPPQAPRRDAERAE